MSGLLAAGAVAASLEAAHADTTAAVCGANNANGYICNLDATITSAGSMSVSVDSGVASEQVNVNWTVTCGSQSQLGATDNATTPLTVPLAPLPATAAGQCTVNVGIRLPAGDVTPKIDYTGTLSYTPAGSTSTSTSAAVHPVKGFGGKCVDDKRNSSANGAAIVIWSCSSTDQAQSWQFSNGELVHNGKCVNDQGNGGIRSHLILYTCNGASNEKWTSMANGEFRLQSHGGTLCADDPRSSTTNGTQLIVYTCADNANQRWSLP